MSMNTPEAQVMARRIGSAFIAFAKHGKPDNRAIPAVARLQHDRAAGDDLRHRDAGEKPIRTANCGCCGTG